MDHLNLNLLKALQVLLQERNVTRAAQQLHLTQSAMSRQLGQLREYFADPLLVRDGNDYLLSSRARQLIPQVQDILAQIGDLKQAPAFDPADCQRRFSFACSDYVAQFIFPDILRQLQSQAPGIDIAYRMWQPDWLNKVGQLSLDLVSTVSLDRAEGLNHRAMGHDSPVCLLANNHPLLSDELSLENMLRFPFVQLSSGGDKDSFFDRLLQAQGLSRRIRYEVPFFAAAFAAMADSTMLLIVPAHIARNAAQLYPLTYRQLPVQTPVFNYYLYWHELHDGDPAHRWLRECIAAQVKTSIFSPHEYDLNA